MGFIKRALFSRPKRIIKNHFKTILTVYLIGLAPANYAMIGLTTNIPVDKPAEIAKTAINHPINTLTLGTLQPLVSGVETSLGSVLGAVGEQFDSQTLVDKSKDLKASADEWFNKTSSVVESAKNVANDVKNTADSVTETAKEVETEATSFLGKIKGWFNSKSSEKSNTTDVQSTNDNVPAWSYEKYPNYYALIGKAEINKSEFGGAGSFKYSPLDNLGRATVAWANIDYTTIKERKEAERPAFTKDADPAGWGHNRKIMMQDKNGTKEYERYAFDRSHMIAWSLGGSMLRDNLITGTRTQNVGIGDGGMAYLEEKIRTYFKSSTKETVYYKVENVYTGNELLPRYTIVNALSTDGKINEKVVVYNTVKGYEVDYKTGKIK